MFIVTNTTNAETTELETLIAEINAYDASVTPTERMNEPAEMTAKRNRASEIIFSQR